MTPSDLPNWADRDTTMEVVEEEEIQLPSWAREAVHEIVADEEETKVVEGTGPTDNIHNPAGVKETVPNWVKRAFEDGDNVTNVVRSSKSNLSMRPSASLLLCLPARLPPCIHA